MDDIINRLKKLNINKSPEPDMIHPRILYETAEHPPSIWTILSTG